MEDSIDTELYFSNYHAVFESESFFKMPDMDASATLDDACDVWFEKCATKTIQPRMRKGAFEKHAKTVAKRMRETAENASCVYAIQADVLLKKMHQIQEISPKMTQKIVAAGTFLIAMKEYGYKVKIMSLCEICNISAPTARKAKHMYLHA
mgnify:CR=1 FL=1